MRNLDLMMPAAHAAALAFVVLTLGCTGVERTPAREPTQAGATQSGPAVTVAPVVPVAPSPPEPPPAVVTPSPPAAIEAVPRPAAPPAAPSIAKAEAPSAKAPPKAPAPPAAAAPSAKKEAPAAVARKPEAPPLDLTSLETRLKETKAIGVMTKLSLKNQVDDLLNQFRAFYQGRLKTTLAELRKSFDLLFLKVLSLLQDSDPPLASAIVASREAIWGILSDPVKFATI